jgi:hypothetical protein
MNQEQTIEVIISLTGIYLKLKNLGIFTMVRLVMREEYLPACLLMPRKLLK